jgi:predicted aconitase with swiveling domain
LAETLLTIHGRKLIGGKVCGTALVSRDSVSFWGGVNIYSGEVNEPGHDINGQCMAGKILVCPSGKGSGAGSLRLYDMWDRGLAPLAILNRKADEVVVIGAIISKIPMIDNFDVDPVETIKTGDELEIDADNGIVMIYRKE